MIKEIAWDTFKNTGDINSFLEFKQIESLENDIQNGVNNMLLQNKEINKNNNEE